MKSLPDYPALAALPALRDALRGIGCAVLAAPPGSGKTTVIPLALLDEPWLAGQRIVMLEPRRIAARASAARMASLMGVRLGETVGYQVRFERKVSAATRVEVITEGLLTRRLQADPALPGIGLVIFDEFHERSLDADLALALTLDVRANLRDDLRVLVMSATLDGARVARLLGAAPLIEAGGRMFPVDIRYAPSRSDVSIEESVAESARRISAETDGDLLAFLPGGREIRAAQRLIESQPGNRLRCHPLYGDLGSAEQDAALAPARDGVRKIILATNIAQTSLTVEGVTAVIDSGWARVARFDLGAGSNRLDTERISRASADQRAGRAGRLGPGLAVRLWSRDQHGRLPAHDLPDVLATDLSRFALELAQWGVADPADLNWMDAPPAAAWSYAQDLLRALRAVDALGRITAHGRALARLPVAPRIAHMLIEARALGLGRLAVWTAAALDERTGSLDLAQAVRELESDRRGADPAGTRRVRETVQQLERLIGPDGDSTGDIDKGSDGRAEVGKRRVTSTEQAHADQFDAIGRVIALAFPERLARRRPESLGVFLCVDGGEARMHEREALAGADWLAIAHWEPSVPRRIRRAAAVAEADVLQDQASRIETKTDVRWDPQIEAVIAERQTRLGALVVSRKPARDDVAEAQVQAMVAGVQMLGIAALPWTDDARQLQARVACLQSWRGVEDWPDLRDEALLVTLADWLAPELAGHTRRDHLARLDLARILAARLDYSQQQRLARLAPTHIDVPSGSRVALDYGLDGAAPVLAVKLQELFGLTRTPTVNDGQKPVSLHLLSPGRRPIQVTQDLAGFWLRTYPEVRRELKGRYPRHPWPDDPLTALPTARAKPRGT